MQYHQYSRLFTSGLFSDPSPPPIPRPRRGRAFLLNPTDSEPLEPAESRTYSFLELVDSLTSPVSPADASLPWHPLGHYTLSYVLFQPHRTHPLTSPPFTSVAASPTPTGKSEPIRMRQSVLGSTSLKPAVPSPTDPFPRLSIVTADQSFFVTDPSLPDSPTLDRRPTHKTVVSVSASSASLSVNSETKRVNRLGALACLEGRESSGKTSRKTQLNFMNMSDDEEEEDSIAPSRRLSTDREATKATRRSSTITASDIAVLAILSSGGSEVELLPTDLPVSQSPPQSKPAPESNRRCSQAIESWFPPLVSSFIESNNDEDSPNWRSFIEFTPAA